MKKTDDKELNSAAFKNATVYPCGVEQDCQKSFETKNTNGFVDVKSNKSSMASVIAAKRSSNR